jgi:hypothetical protein
MSQYQIPDPNRVKKPRAPSRTRSITLKGNLANLFVKSHDKPPETDQEVLERVALSVHMHMASNNIEKAVLVLKAFRNSPPIPEKVNLPGEPAAEYSLSKTPEEG